jgi:hypothetical protein
MPFYLIPIVIIIVLFIVKTQCKSRPYRVADNFYKKIEQKDANGGFELTTGTFN